MQELWHSLKDTILSPEWYIQNGGFYLILFVIFAETGLFVGFFLPGDSLLVAAGMYLDNLSAEFFNFPILLLPLVVAICGILGNYVGYWFGRKSGPYLYSRKDTFFWKGKHLKTASEFYEKNGAFTIIAARFVPIVRTFAPIVAGIVNMDYKKFSLYNIIGSLAWVYSMMLLGYYAQDLMLKKFGINLKEHLEIIVIIIILVTTIPVILKFALAGRKNKA